MKTGFSGTFVIAWTQGELDGLTFAPLSALTVGATWRWTGEAVCIDGARDVYVLENAIGQAELHQRAAQSVRRMIGRALDDAPAYQDGETRARLFNGGFDVTDGLKRYEISLIDMPDLGAPLLMFLGEMPPAETDLWVVSVHVDTVADAQEAQPGGVICFTPGTRILTPEGPRPVEALREGDRVQTKDNGVQKLRWIGQRHISGARLYVMPQLRPIRFRADALGMGEPDEDLIVSPQHRMVLRGQAARDLFNADEVLVCAKDLVNDRSIIVERQIRELDYIHLLFDAHQVIFANGLETESFHPGFADLDEVSPRQREALLARFPYLETHTEDYGPAARRALTAAEAAILLHKVA
ncbi:Hint domain-containing protein [Celeribacter halophilus]|uniref:Hint domain-containing protein n=1 Tax=Celeribacter halophilus TaxID=576117 RepID=UPI001C096198|nr:Hint domain-containing protein [Celeribacter halophilus]MBU2890216.1 Hint domain-containing protein [Celeribacter halophilus]MDO6509891.1 Hint domain-containing protein [Celeribacter halophilus]